MAKSRISPDAIGKGSNYSILRMDGQSGTGKAHDNCTYYVLDLTHDQYAKEAMKAYAEACKNADPNLYHQVINLIEKVYGL